MNRIKLKVVLQRLLENVSERSYYFKIIKQKKIYKDLVNHTKYLSEDTKIPERLYHILNNMNSVVLCEHCGIKTPKFESFSKGYKRFCSTKCSNSSSDVQSKKEITSLKNYGTTNPAQSDEVKKKISDNNPMKLDINKQKIKENWKNKSKNEVEDIVKRRETTTFKNYGVKNVSQSEIIKKQKEETTFKNYGVKHNSQSEIIKRQKIKTSLKNWNEEHPMKTNVVKQKLVDINNDKYGVDYTFQAEEVKEKTKQTNLERYGTEYASSSKIVRGRVTQTNIDRYGVDNFNKLESTKEQNRRNWLRKYGVDNPSKTESFRIKNKERLKEEFLKKFDILQDCFKVSIIGQYIDSAYQHNWKCNICNTEFTTCWNNIQQGFKCPDCFPRNSGISYQEKELVDFIRDVLEDVEIIQSDRTIIAPKELDIYIPSKKIGIEFNGVYWHSEQMETPKDYHLNKTLLCDDNNVRLIHIFEDEWIFKKDIVKYRLKQILNVNTSKRIHARQCIIKEIDPKTKNEFLEKYHIQGGDKSVVKLGAFYNNKLISLMTFSHGNISKGSSTIQNIWELNRFCSDYNYHIPGIASKLLSYFKRNYEWSTIFSYADLRWSDGNLYRKLGFKYSGHTGLNYWYVKGSNRIHRFNLRKSKDDPVELTETELRVSQGYSIIWDCGNLKFELENSST